MLSVHEATNILHQHRYSNLTVESVSLFDCLGRVLAEDIYADRPAPPYDRVAMDGVAVNISECAHSTCLQKKDGVAHAGMPRYQRQQQHSYVEVATGAILPLGTDAVIPYEHLTFDGESLSWHNITLKENLNVHLSGSDYASGAMLLKKGTLLQSQHISVLAAVGKTVLRVYTPYTVLIITTGDEIVPLDSEPMVHQVRASNSVHAAMLLQNFSFRTTILHIKDDIEHFERTLETHIDDYDIVVSIGGISKGIYDVVRNMLKKNAIPLYIDTVAQRPGKPFAFTFYRGKPFFALPGNPIACITTARRYLIPYLFDSYTTEIRPFLRTLGREYLFKKELTRFLLVQYDPTNDTLIPLHDTSSGNFSALVSSVGFLELPAEQSIFPAGSLYTYYPWNTLSE